MQLLAFYNKVQYFDKPPFPPLNRINIVIFGYHIYQFGYALLSLYISKFKYPVHRFVDNLSKLLDKLWRFLFPNLIFYNP